MKFNFIFRIKSNILKLAKSGAIHVIIGNFMTKFVSFFGSIFIVRLLTKSDYGVLSYYENFASYFTILAGLGLASGLLRFIVLAPNASDKKSCFERAILRGTLWNVCLVIVCVLIYIFYPHPYVFKGYVVVWLPLTFCIPFLFFTNASLSVLRSGFDYRVYAFLAFFSSFILVAMRVVGAAFGGILLTNSARLVGEVTCAVIGVFIVYKRYFKGVISSALNMEFTKSMDVYSLQIMLTDGLWAIFMLNNIFLLGQFSGSQTVVADYKVASVIPANLSILTSAIGIFVAPYFTKYENEKNYCWIKKKFILMLTMTALMMGVVTFILFMFSKTIILVLYGVEYMSVIPIMQILLFASFMNDAIRATIANVLSAMGVQKLNLFVACGGMLLQILLNLLLIPSYGGIGVAYSSLVVYFCMSIALAYIFWNKYYRNTVY